MKYAIEALKKVLEAEPDEAVDADVREALKFLEREAEFKLDPDEQYVAVLFAVANGETGENSSIFVERSYYIPTTLLKDVFDEFFLYEVGQARRIDVVVDFEEEGKQLDGAG